MPYVTSAGVQLYYEETGSGIPLLLLHEFGGDLTSWEYQVRFLSRFFRCIRFNARGYPPSDVPTDQEDYSQEIASQDVANLMKALAIPEAHLVGLSMGSVTALDFALHYGQLARSITLCGCGYGSIAAERQAWLKSNADMAAQMLADPAATAHAYANGPTRLPFKRKDPIGWQRFREALMGLDPQGAALTLRGIQARRPSLYDLAEPISRLAMPAMIVVGDEDKPALEPGIFLKRTIPDAALWVFPRTGHAVNNEEPALFNRVLLEFLVGLDSRR